LSFLLSVYPLSVVADNNQSFSYEATNSIGELNGYLSGNIKALKQFYADRKFTYEK